MGPNQLVVTSTLNSLAYVGFSGLWCLSVASPIVLNEFSCHCTRAWPEVLCSSFSCIISKVNITSRHLSFALPKVPCVASFPDTTQRFLETMKFPFSFHFPLSRFRPCDQKKFLFLLFFKLSRSPSLLHTDISCSFPPF